MNLNIVEKFSYEKYLNRGDVVYDIGAHVGEMTTIFVNGGAKVVYAFEPSPFNINKLIAKTKNLDKVKVFDVALHEVKYDCSTKFKDCSVGSEQNIKYVILEDFVKENSLEMPDFIKMDIEGMESIVLKTMDFIFQSPKRPKMYLEMHPAPRLNRPHDYADNPHWKYVGNGGYDFNRLKDFGYVLIDESFNVLRKEDFNPPEGKHCGVAIIPEELA